MFNGSSRRRVELASILRECICQKAKHLNDHARDADAGSMSGEFRRRSLIEEGEGMRNAKGQSLIEILMGIVLFGIIGAGALRFFKGNHQSNVAQALEIDSALTSVLREIESGLERGFVGPGLAAHMAWDAGRVKNSEFRFCIEVDGAECEARRRDGRIRYPFALLGASKETRILAGPPVSPVLYRGDGVRCATPNAWSPKCPLAATIEFEAFCEDDAARCDRASLIRFHYVVRVIPDGGANHAAQRSVHKTFLKSFARADTPFALAVLAKDLTCFFCHLDIRGDVGGFDLPPTNSTHPDSGTGVRISGRFYATSDIPDQLKGLAARGDVPNYRNTGERVFPRNLKEFPKIDEAHLAPRMNGTLRADGVTIRGTAAGNLIIDCSKKTIEIRGEVYVKGDVVIKGRFRGTGTLYATNIFVVDDIIAESSPFPFPDDEAKALAIARASLARGDDALHLGALNQILIGDFNRCDPKNPGIWPASCPQLGYTLYKPKWISERDYVALGTSPKLLAAEVAKLFAQGKWVDDLGKNNFVFAPKADFYNEDPTLRLDVARIDAYMFANGSFI